MDPEQIIDDVGAPGSEPPAPEPEPSPLDDGWKVSKSNGRLYVNLTPGKRGRGAHVLYRQGTETIAEALARDQRERAEARDKRPRPKKTPKMPAAPAQVDLRELEKTLAEALKAPAMLAASFGDEWGAEHFTKSGPYLARNLVLAADHNPWLRRKLEEAATGEDAMMMVVSLVGVGGALFAYTVPPVIYYFNLPAPRRTRELFGIPARKGQPPEYAAGQSSETPPPPAFAEAA